MMIRSRRLRPRRSSFQTVRVSLGWSFLRQARAVCRHPGDPVILEKIPGRHSGLLQSGELQAGVLVVGGDARVAVFHGFILGQSFGTRKPAFLAGLANVPKLTLCETRRGLIERLDLYKTDF
jgi:hypothetical protein